jgi:hypothetical protein
MNLSTLHKTAFLANLSLGLAMVLRVYPFLGDSGLKSTLIVLGYLGSYGLNAAALLTTAWIWVKNQSWPAELSRVLAVINAIVFIIQLYMLLK